MARKLPWETTGAPSKPPSRAPKSSVPSKRKSPAAASGYDDGLSNSDSEPLDKGKKRATQQNTSLPPDELMRPGLNHDDQYIMVEDEFLSTASLYTADLHHDAYDLHKKLAAASAKSSFKSVARGTSGHGKMSVPGQLRQQATELDRKQKKAFTNMGLEEDDPYMKNPLLAGLMRQDSSVGGVKISGLIRSSQERRKRPNSPDTIVESEDEHDLDVVPVRRPVIPPRQSSPVIPTVPKRRELNSKLQERMNKALTATIPKSPTINDTGFNLRKPVLTGKFADKFKRSQASKAAIKPETELELKEVAPNRRLSDIPFFLLS